jgi:F0F1-type ATP synthase alpha subunit
VYFSVKNVDGKIYLYTKMRTEKMDFENPPKIKIRRFADNIIELTGEKLTSQNDMVAIPIGVMIIPVSEKNVFARFAVTESEMELIKEGVTKIRVYTLPDSYDKSFKKDNLGKKIYKQYQKSLTEGNDDF